jgi:hypothetical protein
MFNPFKKKETSVNVIDKIWMSEMSKYNGIFDLWKKNPELVIISWFTATLQNLETLFAKTAAAPASFFLVKEIHGSQLSGKKIIFSEHYPLYQKEQELFKQWQLGEAIVHSALDEPLFMHFGGEKIISMMKQLGMKEDSQIENKMISHAIRHAQEKIENKVLAEHTANSQQEWIQRNLPA